MDNPNQLKKHALSASLPHQLTSTAEPQANHEANIDLLSQREKGPIEQILSSRRSVRHTETEASPNPLSNNKTGDYFTKQQIVFNGKASTVS
jgi:hypothetical protein